MAAKIAFRCWSRISLQISVMVLVLAITGCMVSPYDGQTFSGLYGEVKFSGFNSDPNSLIFVKVFDPATGNWIGIDVADPENTATFITTDGMTAYYWEAYVPIPQWAWPLKEVNGVVERRARVKAVRQDGQVFISVNSDWQECAPSPPSATGFYNKCQSAHSPEAILYGPTKPYVQSINPTTAYSELHPGSYVVQLKGYNLTHPKTNGFTINNDVKIYRRRISPTTSGWTLCKLAAWSPDEMFVALSSSEKGPVGAVNEFKIVVKVLGESNIVKLTSQ